MFTGRALLYIKAEILEFLLKHRHCSTIVIHFSPLLALLLLRILRRLEEGTHAHFVGILHHDLLGAFEALFPAYKGS